MSVSPKQIMFLQFFWGWTSTPANEVRCTCMLVANACTHDGIVPALPAFVRDGMALARVVGSLVGLTASGRRKLVDAICRYDRNAMHYDHVANDKDRFVDVPIVRPVHLVLNVGQRLCMQHDVCTYDAQPYEDDRTQHAEPRNERHFVDKYWVLWGLAETLDDGVSNFFTGIPVIPLSKHQSKNTSRVTIDITSIAVAFASAL